MISDKLVLAPFVRLGYFNSKLYIGFGSIMNCIESGDFADLCILMTKIWRLPHTTEEIEVIFAKSFAQDLINKGIELFINNYVVNESVMSVLSEREDRYNRSHIFYSLSKSNPLQVTKFLQNSHVIILGCGGIGNIVATLLATNGVGTITLVDDDRIELSNLTRQLMFTEIDVGKNKTIILKSSIEKRNSSVIVNTINLRIASYQDLLLLPPNINLIILSADEPSEIIKWVNLYSIAFKVPFINIGYVEDIAVWGPFVIPGITSCWECQDLTAVETFDSPDDNKVNKVAIIKEINKQYVTPSFGPVNLLAASTATLDVLKYLGGFGKVQSFNKRLGIWTDELKIEIQDCNRNPNCHVCKVV